MDDENGESIQLERLFIRVIIISQRDGDDENADDDDVEIKISQDEEAQNLAVYFAASFAEEKGSLFDRCEKFEDESEWRKRLDSWLRDCDDVVGEAIIRCSSAFDSLVDGLFAMYSLSSSSSKAKFNVGDHILAVLTEDEQWHEAKVEKVTEAVDSIEYLVRFIEYGKPQIVTNEDDIVLDKSWLDENDDEGACQICRRSLPLTFHHLIPKETHSHMLKKGGKSLIDDVEVLYQNRADKYRAKSRKDWLEVYGVNICRKCHSQVHRVESNMSLAMNLNTLHLVLQHPAISKWRSWASHQK
jgi:5-methylcytosine-specific restriction endonuclease McrA